MTIDQFLSKLKNTPDEIQFEDTMTVVESNYDFTPTAFTNGNAKNKAGENSGSCKLFAFAKENKLTVDETLNCFGTYYREHVIENPNGDDHQNIRNFIKFGWKGISFESKVLTKK